MVTKGTHILIVDDDHLSALTLQHLLHVALEDEDSAVHIGHDLPETLGMLRDYPVRVALVRTKRSGHPMAMVQAIQSAHPDVALVFIGPPPPQTRQAIHVPKSQCTVSNLAHALESALPAGTVA